MDSSILWIASVYFLLSLSLGFWVARKEKNRVDDYFLAGKKLPWYAVSLSMTGSNIGTEHFVGMVGTAYVFGLAPATFEWGNFIPYSVLIWIFLPYFYRKHLYTIPEFLERRYSPATRSIFACLTLAHMVLAVLTPALYAGGRIVFEMAFQTPLVSFNWIFMMCIVIIAAVTAAYCIYGGLLSVVWTDVLQVMVLVVGGLLLVWLGLKEAGGIQAVIDINQAADSERFSLIHDANHPISPWTGVMTFWLTLSMWYVGTNQFYIQRCLGARSEWDAKMGVIGCAFLKFFLPLIIVLPGMIAFALLGPNLAEDAVYVQLVNTLLNPVGKGIMLAALIAAIMSTVSSVLNSASTIWSMDVHKRFLNRNADEEQLVRIGRWTSFFIIVLGTLLAPLLLQWEGGIFIYIQDLAAFFAPPISVIFLAAFLWKKAHGRSASLTLIFGIVVGLALKILTEMSTHDITLALKPLLNRAAVSWVLCAVFLLITTYAIQRNPNERPDPDTIWTLRWARLPEQERGLNRGIRNLMGWWIALIVLSFGLFIYFR